MLNTDIRSNSCTCCVANHSVTNMHKPRARELYIMTSQNVLTLNMGLSTNAYTCTVLMCHDQKFRLYELFDNRRRDYQASPNPTLLGKRRTPFKKRLIFSSCHRDCAPIPMYRMERHETVVSFLRLGHILTASHYRCHGWCLHL